MLRIGILGASRIVPWALAEPAARRDDTRLLAIAARRAGSAQLLASQYGIERVYDSYDDVIADPDIDLIYNPLPPHLHAEWSIKALDAGKHVLCEKPFAMNADEARRMNEAAKRSGRRIIEAFHDRYHPVFLHLQQQVNAGRVGKVRNLDAIFNHTIPRIEGEFRRIASMGGGALMDLGCYPIHWCRSLTGEEPTVTDVDAVLDPAGYDEEVVATLRFPSDVEARIECRMTDGWQYYARFTIEGDRGTIIAENSLLPHRGHTIIETVDGIPRQYTIGGGTTFDYQLAAVVSALAEGSALPTEGTDPVGNMAAIDAIYAQASLAR